MPDMQAAVRTRLCDDTAVTSIAAGRIYWVERPQATALPAITLQTVSDDRLEHMKGAIRTRATRVQLDCWAPTYSAPAALATAAIAAVVKPATVGGKRFLISSVEAQRDMEDDAEGTPIHRRSVDLIIWHIGE